MSRDERLRAIAEAFGRWEARYERTTTPDPVYARSGRSQYAEGIVALSAPPAAQAELVALIGRAGKPS
jgi:hypothetical protein